MITRWQGVPDVSSGINRLQNEMNRIFARDGISSTAGAFPALNMWQDDESFFVEAELPGLELDDIEIFVDRGDQLTIKGARKAPVHEQGTWHRQERGFGDFRRIVELPSMVDSEQVEAVLANGVLTIKLPRPEETKPRKIVVKTD